MCIYRRGEECDLNFCHIYLFFRLFQVLISLLFYFFDELNLNFISCLQRKPKSRLSLSSGDDQVVEDLLANVIKSLLIGAIGWRGVTLGVLDIDDFNLFGLVLSTLLGRASMILGLAIAFLYKTHGFFTQFTIFIWSTILTSLSRLLQLNV